MPTRLARIKKAVAGIYLEEALDSKVQAECGPCNRKHGGGLRYPGKKDLTRRGARQPRRTAHTCWCGDIDCRDHGG